jgi:outer membrane protein assembly factor BamB
MGLKRTVLSVVLGLTGATALSADWPQWRGPNGNGTATDTGIISTWSPVTGENVVFKIPLVGRSTPAVFDGRVCASARADGRYETIACYSAKDGAKLWERRYVVHNTTIPYARVGWASVSGDPETGYLYAQNGDGLLLAFDRAGKTMWEVRLGEEMGRSSGYGGRTHSPLIDDDSLLVSIVGTSWGEHAPLRQRYASLDKRTGKVQWFVSPSTATVEDFNNQANAIVANIGGERLMIGGGADGWIYALRARTGELVWNYRFSPRSLNAPVTVRDGIVYANQSEEPLEGGFMGQVIAIDGARKGDITATGRKWNADAITAGFAAPLLDGNRVYVVDNSGNIHALNATTGARLYEANLGTIGRGSATLADGKIFATEVNGNMHILKPLADKFETLSHVQLKMPEGRHVEVWGSVAPAYGRLYLLTENFLYCLGDKKAAYKGPAPGAPATSLPWPPKEAAASDQPVASIAVFPTELMVKAGEKVTFEVRGFDAQGRRVKAPAATFALAGLTGTVDANGVFVGATTPVLQAGKVVAKAGTLEGSARVRVFGPLPWSEDFEGNKVPGHWVGAGRLAIGDSPEGKILAKAPVQTGLNRATVFIGPATMQGYTMESDVRATRTGRRMGDIGLINNGYTLDMQGVHQKLQIRSWASELAFSKEIPFTVESDVWYRMKLAVQPGKTNTVVRGKVWKRGEAEPAAWTIEFDDPVLLQAGAPGLYGDSPANIAWDNLKITSNR